MPPSGLRIEVPYVIPVPIWLGWSPRAPALLVRRKHLPAARCGRDYNKNKEIEKCQ